MSLKNDSLLVELILVISKEIKIIRLNYSQILGNIIYVFTGFSILSFY